MEDIVIVGSGGFAREVKWLLEENNKIEYKWNILGWISNETVGTIINGLPVLGNDNWLMEKDSDINAVIALGDGMLRKKLASLYMSNSHIKFPTIIAHNAVIGNTVSLGIGGIISFNSLLTVDISVGNFFICNLGGEVGHDCKIGNYVTINPGADIAGNVILEDCSTIGIGANIIQGCTIGECTFIGAGATVINDIPCSCTAVGVPAKILEKTYGR